MTVGTPAWIAADSGTLLPSYDATELRAIDTLYTTPDGVNNLGARAGVRPGGTSAQLTVSGTTWSVATGIVSVNAIASGVLGEYRVPITATESGTIPARDATFDRKDIVVVRVYDAEAGDGTREAVVQYITGTPASVPAAPSVPAKSFLVGTITVPKVTPGNAISVAQNTQYTVASGGTLPTAVRPTNPYPGQVIYNLANGDVEVWNGSRWVERPLIPPKARMRAVSTQTFANATFTPVALNQVDYDTGSMTDLTNWRITAPRAGVYDVLARAAFLANATGYRRVDLLINGTLYGGYSLDAQKTTGVTTTVVFQDKIKLVAGDILSMQAYQTSGATLGASFTGAWYNTLAVIWEGPL